MNEGTFWSEMVGPNLGKMGHLSRVENAVELGTPDVNYAVRGTQGWLELKIVRRGKIYFKRSQIPWMKARLRHCGGGGLWVLGAEEDRSAYYLWFAKAIVEAPRVPHKAGVLVQVGDLAPRTTWRGKVDWQGLALCLTFPAGLNN